jgi:hypothetical protein
MKKGREHQRHAFLRGLSSERIYLVGASVWTILVWLHGRLGYEYKCCAGFNTQFDNTNELYRC